jgi:predicted DNA-binding transcriptional regulator AlpA
VIERPLNARDAAEFLGISRRALYHLVARGVLVSCGRGRSLRFRPSELLRSRAGHGENVVDFHAAGARHARGEDVAS